MRTIYRLDGKMINLEAPRIIGDVSYPNLRDVWQSVGVVQAEVDDFPDLRAFDCTEDEAGNLTITPKDPAEIAYHEQINLNAASLVYLTSTDWYVSRFAETATPIPDDVKAKRQAARDAIVHLVMPL